MHSPSRLATAIIAGLFVAAACTAVTTPTPVTPPTATTSPATSTPTASALLTSPPPSPGQVDPLLNTVVVTVSDRLRVRSEPRVSDDSITYEPVLPLGAQLNVVGGPVVASGYRWYEVEPIGFELNGGVTRGWVAMADHDGTPWIAVAPTAPATGSPSPGSTSVPSPSPGPTVVPSPWQGLSALATSGTLFVAVTDTAFWSSSDGATWQQSSGPSGGVVSDFAFHPSGAGIAVGTFGTHAAVWTSPDSVRWTMLPDQPALLPLPGEANVRLRLVARTASSYVAVGESGPATVILVSNDGVAWSRTRVPSILARVTVESIEAAKRTTRDPRP